MQQTASWHLVQTPGNGYKTQDTKTSNKRLEHTGAPLRVTNMLNLRRSAENMKTIIIIFISTMIFAYLGYLWGQYTERTGLAIGFFSFVPSHETSESIKPALNTIDSSYPQNTKKHECTFVPGWDIIKENDGKKFELPIVKRWNKEILEGINFLHSNHIIHRDIKPR